jgi:quinol monooxygenase YgiN
MALFAVSGCQQGRESATMYGIIGQFIAVSGKRDELVEVLLAGTKGMPGCLSYVVSKDLTSDDSLWITEVWDSKESHAASLSLPSVQEAMKQGRPLISGFGQRYETNPVGGHGL